MSTEIETPFLRFRARRRGYHGEAGEATRELNQDRADPAGATHDQKRARIDALAGHHTQAVEQQFPGSDRSQGQGGRLR
jgi:hypothetical protein